MFSLMFTWIFKLNSTVLCIDHVLFREIVIKLFEWELSSQLYLTSLGLKMYSMHQKSCINALFTKIVTWKCLIRTQVSYVLRIVGKMLSPAVLLMIKGWKQSVLPPDLKELSKLFFFLFPNSINFATPSDHCNM